MSYSWEKAWTVDAHGYGPTGHMVQAVGFRSDGKAFFHNELVAANTPEEYKQARARALYNLNRRAFVKEAP